MKSFLRLTSPVLLITLVSACAPTPTVVGGVLLISTLAQANSSDSETSIHFEDETQNTKEGGNTADPVSLILATATGRVSTEPNRFTILFDFDRANIMPEQTDTLDAIVAIARGGQQVRLIVSGHADRSGPEPYNVLLSRRRAKSVKGELSRRGLKRDWITITAHGEAMPRVTTPDGFREPRNRRVEIILGISPSL